MPLIRRIGRARSTSVFRLWPFVLAAALSLAGCAPLRRNVKFGEQDRENTLEQREIAWFDEGKETLAQRVQQINTGIHWAEEPLSRVRHIVSNVRILSAAPDQATVSSHFLVYRNRLQDETDIFVGKRRDVLRRVDGAWRIARREIFLDQNVLLAKNLTVFF